MKKFILSLIFIPFSQSFCFSQTMGKPNVDSLTFSAILDSTNTNGQLLVTTILKNNTNRIIVFISQTCPANAIYTIDNSELQKISYDCSTSDHPIRITLPPFGTFKDLIFVNPPLKFPQTNFKGSFRIGFKYLKANKTENIKKKSALLNNTTDIVWSNAIKVN